MHGEGGGEGLLPVNGAVLALILIFIPGILCYGLVATLTEKKNRDNATTLIQIFMYGVSSYLILYVAHGAFPSVFHRLGIHIENIHLLSPADIERYPIDPVTVIAASVIGTFEGILIALNINYDVAIRLCRFARLTKRFGDANVWSFLFNSNDTDNWVTIRHKERGHIYQGYVQAFSSGDEKRELLLVLVRVYDLDTAAKVGDIPVLYMSFKDDDVVLEFGVKPSTSAEAH